MEKRDRLFWKPGEKKSPEKKGREEKIETGGAA